MISRDEVVAHQTEVLEAEAAFMLENTARMLAVSTAKSLAETSRVLTQISGEMPDNLSTCTFTPRPSLKVLKAAYIDMAHNDDPQTVLEFTGADSLARAGIPDMPAPISGRLTGKVIDSCADAEPQFVAAVDQMRGGNVVHPHISVYHDPDGVPIALRKSKIVGSALLLEGVQAGDIIVPAGTIVRVDPSMGAEKTGGQFYQGDEDCWDLASYKVEGEFAFRPARPSAWAYTDGADRALFGATRISTNDYLHVDEYRVDLVTGHNLGNFRDAALMALTLTGVNPAE